MSTSRSKGRPLEIFFIFLRLGLSSFGGPIAHLSYFRREFVEQRRWISEQTYTDILVLCQFLPGPASSQVGIVLGLSRGGYWGSLAAWLGFTLPSALLMILFGFGLGWFQTPVFLGAERGMMLLVVAVVAQAILNMARQFSCSIPRMLLSLAAGLGMIFSPSYLAQVFLMTLSGLTGVLFRLESPEARRVDLSELPTRGAGRIFLTAFTLLLILSAFFASSASQEIQLHAALYRAGATVFGGGHAVLPLLQDMVVTNGILPLEEFLAGYGAAQALPGPLFSFSAFLGTRVCGSVSGGLTSLLAIFLPAVLLVLGVLPFWDEIRRRKQLQSFFHGVNSAVVGVLFATWYRLILWESIHSWAQAGIALCAFVALTKWRISPMLLVFAFALYGAFFERF